MTQQNVNSSAHIAPPSLELQGTSLPTTSAKDGHDNEFKHDAQRVSYINQIPTELLLEIFSLSLVEGIASTTIPSSTLWKLAHVCSFWRTIVSECMPSTWASITLPEPRPALLLVLNVCLSRAKDLPLSITLHCSRKTSTEDFQSCLDFLVQECHRWQSLSIALPVDLLDHFETNVQGRLPLLESLSFALVKPGFFSRQTPPQPVTAFQSAPRLHKVYLSSSSQLSLDNVILPLCQLTSLRIPSEVMNIKNLERLCLEQAQNLRELAVNKIAAGSGGSGSGHEFAAAVRSLSGFSSHEDASMSAGPVASSTSSSSSITSVLSTPTSTSTVSIPLASLELNSTSEGCFSKLVFPSLGRLTIQSAERRDFDGLSYDGSSSHYSSRSSSPSPSSSSSTALNPSTAISTTTTIIKTTMTTTFPSLTHLTTGLILSMRPDALFALLRATPRVKTLVLNVAVYSNKEESLSVMERLFEGLGSGSEGLSHLDEDKDNRKNNGKNSDSELGLLPKLSSLTFAQLYFPPDEVEAEGTRSRFASRLAFGSGRRLGLGVRPGTPESVNENGNGKTQTRTSMEGESSQKTLGRKRMLDAFVKMIRSRLGSLERVVIEKVSPPSVKEELKGVLREFVVPVVLEGERL